jgi:hypothetical protein
VVVSTRGGSHLKWDLSSFEATVVRSHARSCSARPALLLVGEWREVAEFPIHLRAEARGRLTPPPPRPRAVPGDSGLGARPGHPRREDPPVATFPRTGPRPRCTHLGGENSPIPGPSPGTGSTVPRGQMLYTLRPRLGSHHCPRGQLGPAETWGRGGGIPGGVQTESGGAVQLAPPCPYGDVNGRRGATRGNSLPSRRLRLRARAAEGPRRSGGRSPVRGPFRPGGSTAGEDRTARTLLARVPGARALRISTAAPLPSSREGRERSAGSWSAGSWTTGTGHVPAACPRIPHLGTDLVEAFATRWPPRTSRSA